RVGGSGSWRGPGGVPPPHLNLIDGRGTRDHQLVLVRLKYGPDLGAVESKVCVEAIRRIRLPETRGIPIPPVRRARRIVGEVLLGSGQPGHCGVTSISSDDEPCLQGALAATDDCPHTVDPA